MSRFHGRMGDGQPKNGRKNKGVLAAVRAAKRDEAEARNALTPPERRRAYRRTVAA